MRHDAIDIELGGTADQACAMFFPCGVVEYPDNLREAINLQRFHKCPPKREEKSNG